jgi:hypothetical protein
MIDQVNAAQISPGLSRRIAHFLFVTQYGNARQFLLGRETRGDDGAGIFTFRKNDVLWL